MEKSLEVGDMKEAGKCLWNKSLPDGPRGVLQPSTRTTGTFIVILLLYFFGLRFHVPSCYAFRPVQQLCWGVCCAFLTHVPHGTALSVSLARVCATRWPPRQHVAGHGQTVRGNQGWSLAAVKAACAGLTLSCRVCSVSGTSRSIPPPPACSSGWQLPILSFRFSFYFLFGRNWSTSTFKALLVGYCFVLLPLTGMIAAACRWDASETSGFKQQLSQQPDLQRCQELFARERPYCQQATSLDLSLRRWTVLKKIILHPT